MIGLPKARHMCPVDGCGWGVDDEPITGAVLPEHIPFAALGRAQRLETALKKHAESHDVLDFLRTIARLKIELALAGGPVPAD